jgi:hypothetical protein
VALPQVIFEVDFTATAAGAVFTVGDPTLGRVGLTAVGSSDVWTDVTTSVRSWSVKRGAGRGDDPTLRYDAGVASIELNDGDRRFDPENLSGPYVSAGVTQVEPMRRVRIRSAWAGVVYPIFQGYADDWVPNYQGNSWTYTTLSATDASVVLNSVNRTAVTPVGAGENAGARVTRILDSVGWPSTARVIATGDTTLQDTDLAGLPLTELQLVQDTEQGELYIDAQSRVVFRNRQASLEETRSNTSQATFGDDAAGGAYVDLYDDVYGGGSEIPYADAVQSTPGDTLVNTVIASRAGGTEQSVSNAASVSRYTTKTHTRDDLLMQDDAGALQWASALLYQYGTPARRFARLTFNTPTPQVEAVFWPALLGREFGDRITVIRRPAGGGTITRDCFVRGVEHESNGVEWTSAFVLQGADRFAFFRVGDPILGRVGLNAISY